MSIAGGDTNTWDGPLAISITLLGTPGPRRTAARDRPGRAIESSLPARWEAACWAGISTSNPA